MHTINVTLGFQNYIAQPYWAEKGEVIEIQKASGASWARSPEKEQKAIEAFLHSIGKDMVYYRELEALPNRQWHKNADGMILVPANQFVSCLVVGADEGPKQVRIPNI